MFDARNNVPRIERVLVARGRDAAIVTLGPNTLESFRIFTEDVSGRTMFSADCGFEKILSYSTTEIASLTAG